MKDSSVIFLKDWSMLIKSLSNENQLYFWSLFMQYEHNLDIDCDNEFVLPIWNFVKSQLDKMKEKYFEKTVLTNRNNGKLGGRPKKNETQNNPMGLNETQNNPMGLNETQITPKDKDNNKDNNKDKDKYKDKDLPPTAKPKTFKDFTKEDFHAEIKKFVEQYSKETCRAFFDYWVEPDAKGKMRFQLEKTWATKNRLNMWKSNEGKFGNNSGGKKQILTMY